MRTRDKGKRKLFLIFCLFLTLSLALMGTVAAHAPISGEVDNESLDKALVISDPLKSWVIYKELHTAGEANYYTFNLSKGDHLTANLLIPISEKGAFLPNLAIVGPGVPDQGKLPAYVQVPNGTHVKVVNGTLPAKPGYEPFTPASSYMVADVEMNVTESGTYYVIIYDAQGGGHYSLAIGYKEEFTVSEWLLIPFNVLSIHLWEGQNPAFLFAPLALTIIIGVALIVWKRPQVFKRLPAWTGIPAGLLFLGSGFLTLTQMLYALSTAPDPIALVTLVFTIVALIVGFLILRVFLKGGGKLRLRQRIYLVVFGAVGLVAWAGFLVGPILCFVTALLPDKTLKRSA